MSEVSFTNEGQSAAWQSDDNPGSYSVVNFMLVCFCVSVSQSTAERTSVRRTMIRANRDFFRALQEPIIRKRALQKHIEDERSRETESNGDNVLSARLSCGSLRFCADAAQRPRSAGLRD